MRRIITITLMSLGLTGGVALADNHGMRDNRVVQRGTSRGYDRGFQRGVERGNGYNRGVEHDNRGVDRAYNRGFERGERREQRVDQREDRREERFEHFRDYNFRPAMRFERHEDRAGFQWVAGDWQWDGYEWQWVPGHYVRAYYGWGY